MLHSFDFLKEPKDDKVPENVVLLVRLLDDEQGEHHDLAPQHAVLVGDDDFVFVLLYRSPNGGNEHAHRRFNPELRGEDGREDLIADVNRLFCFWEERNAVSLESGNLQLTDFNNVLVPLRLLVAGLAGGEGICLVREADVVSELEVEAVINQKHVVQNCSNLKSICYNLGDCRKVGTSLAF